jgi:hypothetical protein
LPNAGLTGASGRTVLAALWQARQIDAREPRGFKAPVWSSNRDHQIAGTFKDENGIRHGFIRNP